MKEWIVKQPTSGGVKVETFKDLREASGMTRLQFSEYFGIPYRTIQDWELGNRRCLPYLMGLMEYKLKHEGMIRADMEGGGER